MDLPRALFQRARAGLSAPRPADELARAVHPRHRSFVLEQLLLGSLAAGPTPGRAAFVAAFALAAGIPTDEVAALQSEAALLHATDQRWIDSAPAGAGEWDADRVLERVADTFTDNLEALVTELRETGELGQLLAKAAAGHTLRPDERAKVKAQLIDLAKAVPALAIFAAPGGMLLLPLLAKLLPFSVLPSAWEEKPAPKPGAKPPLLPPPLPTKRTGSD
jgi:hypothetical protein